MTEDSFPRGKTFRELEWLLDAWQAGLNRNSLSTREELIANIQSRLSKGLPRSGTWDFWNLASMMAILGWREVKSTSDSGSALILEADGFNPKNG